jgi:hypothetical protein
MKISWGTGIVIAFGLFITFILYFVLRFNPIQNNELVVEEYYKHDAHLEMKWHVYKMQLIWLKSQLQVLQMELKYFQSF